MATLSAADRAKRIADWRARHPGQRPPTHIEPPGMHAPPRAPKEARRLVERTIAQHRREVHELTEVELRALAPIFDQAERELATELRNWIELAPDGELRWTAQRHRAALAQVREGRRALQEALRARRNPLQRARDALLDLFRRIAQAIQRAFGRRLEASVDQVLQLGTRHVAADLARFSEVFEGSVRTINLDAARILATGRSYIIPRIRTSAARYAGTAPGSSQNIISDLRQRLAVDILKGATVHETTNRLVEHGGPRGLVSTRGLLGDPHGEAEFIAEGLFKRYRYWAERIVRTEWNSAYNAATLDSLDEASDQVPELHKLWMASPGCCIAICAPLDGQVIPLKDKFRSSVGPVDQPPAHPNDRCTVTGWCENWGKAPALPESAKGKDADRRLHPPSPAPARATTPPPPPPRDHGFPREKAQHNRELTERKHTRGGAEARREARRGRAQHVFHDDVDLDALAARVLAEGEDAPPVRGFRRVVLRMPHNVGVRIEKGVADIPLNLVEAKAKLNRRGEWEYHLVPRTKPAK